MKLHATRPSRHPRTLGRSMALVLTMLLLAPALLPMPERADAATLDPPSDHTYRGAILDASPLAWWRLGDIAGPEALDSSTVGRSGQFDSATAFGVTGALVSDQNNAAANSVGPILTAASAGLPGGNSPRSAELWFDVTAESGPLLRYGDFEVALASPTELTIGDATTTATVALPYRVSGDRWHHLGLSADGSRLVVLLDGQLVANQAVAPFATVVTDPAIVGGAAGVYDEVAIYGAALDPAVLEARWNWALMGTDVCLPVPVDPSLPLDDAIRVDAPDAWWRLDASVFPEMARDSVTGCGPAAVGNASMAEVGGGFRGPVEGRSSLSEGAWAVSAGSADLDAQSVEAWFALSEGSSPRRKLIRWGDVSVDVVWDSTIEARVGAGPVSKADVAPPVTDGRVHQLVLTRAGGNVDVWIDGARVAQAAGTANVAGQPLLVGGTVGRWSELAAFPTALTPERISQHWAAGVSTLAPCRSDGPGSGYGEVVAQSAPVGYWPLGDGSADGLDRVAAAGVGCRPAQVTGGTPTPGAIAAADGPTGLRGVNGAIVEVPQDLVRDLASPWTAEFWAKNGAVVRIGDVELVAPQPGASASSLGLRRQGDSWSSIASATAPNWGGQSWNHVALSWTGSGWTVVANGVATMLGASDKQPGGRGLSVRTGPVDELAFYARQVSVDELRRHQAIGWSASGEACRATPNSGHAQAVLATQPVAYWRLDDLDLNSRARVFQDVAGSCSFLFADGDLAVLNGALAGTNRAAELGYGDAALTMPGLGAPWTVEAWVRAQPGNGELALERGNDWVSVASDGSIGAPWLYAPPPVDDPLPTPPDDTPPPDDIPPLDDPPVEEPPVPDVPAVWHHVALVHADGQLHSYVDGVLVATETVQDPWDAATGASTLRVSGEHGATGFDELAVHPQALTLEQLSARVADAARADTATTVDATVAGDGTITASVQVRGDASTPAGSVALFDGASEIDRTDLDAAGAASFTVPLGAGRDLQLAYLGTATDMPSRSARVLLGLDATWQASVSLTIDGMGGRSGDQAIAYAMVTGPDPAIAPSGYATVEVDGEPVFTRSLDERGGVTFVLSRLAKGDHQVRVRYGGDERHRPAWSPSVPVQRMAYQATLQVNSSTPGPYSDADPWFMSGAIAAEAGGPIPTGTVTVSVDGRVVDSGTVGIQRTSWYLRAGEVALGEHTLQVAYSGDANYAAVQLAPQVATFELMRPQVQVEQAWDNPGMLAVKVFPIRDPFDLDGTVAVSLDGQPLGEARLTPVEEGNDGGFYGYSGGAQLPAPDLQAGDHQITVTVTPDRTDLYQPTTWESTLSWKAATNLAWTVSDSTPAMGQTVTFAVDVSSGAGIPAGAVYLDGYRGQVDQQGHLAFDLVVDRADYSLTFQPNDSELFTDSSSDVHLDLVRSASQAWLASEANPIGTGSATMLTATVDGLYEPTGYVSFIVEGATEPLGTGYLWNGSASLSVSFDTAGTRRIKAVYGGDDANDPSESAWLELAVEPTPTIALALSPDPLVAGTDATLLADVTAQGGDPTPVGDVAFYDGSRLVGTQAVSPDGQASIVVSAVAAGPHQFRVVFSGNGFGRAEAVRTVTAGNAPALLDVVATGTSIRTGVNVALTLSVPDTEVVPTGYVSVLLDGEALGTYWVYQGTASFSVRPTAGAHELSATYGGDVGVAPAGPIVRSFTLDKDLPQLTASIGPPTISPDGTVTVAASVNTYHENVHPSGGVVIAVDGVDRAARRFDSVIEGYRNYYGSLIPDQSMASWQGTITEPGDHLVSVRYEGDENYEAAPPVTATVKVGETAVLAVGAVAPDPVAGRPFTVPVTVSDAASTSVPGGAVLALIGNTVVGSASLVDGAADLSVVLPAAGANQVTFRYSGDAQFGPTEQVRTITATRAQATISVSADPIAPAAHQAVTLWAQVAPDGGVEGSLSPNGYVTFKEGDVVLGTNGLYRGAAGLTIGDGLLTGDHTITATYGGDAIYDPVTAAPFVLSVGRPLDATFALDGNEGVAPFNVTATASAVGQNPPDAAYEWKFGDGTTADGPTATHHYADPGIYTMTLTVLSGGRRAFRAQKVTVISNEAVQANAGGDRVTVVDEAVPFDGRASTPNPGLRTFLWNFGDGTTALGDRATHTYATTGTYTARLTVWAASGDPSTDTVTVTVLPPQATGLVVNVSVGGAPLAGADVVVMDQIRGRIAGVSGPDGRATLYGLDDGSYTVFVAAPGLQPTTATATVVDGSGEALAVLSGAPVGTAVLDAHRMTSGEMAAVGIDPTAPENQGTTSFTIELNYIHRDVYVRPDGQFSGGGGLGFGSSFNWVSPSGDRVVARSYDVDGERLIHWLTIPGGSQYVKEFFAINLTVTSLAPEPFRFTDGSASLDLPSGLVLAPTSTPQSRVVQLGDLAAGSSVSTTWYVRGDGPGSFDLSAVYSAVLSPTGTPVRLVAQTDVPIRVYGSDAVRLMVEAEASGTAGLPYRFRVGAKNYTDGAAYNVTFTLNDSPGYLFQPDQKKTWVWASVPAGQTVWSDEFVILPNSSGQVMGAVSLVKYTGGEADEDHTVSTWDASMKTDPSVLVPASQPRGGAFMAWHPTTDESPISGDATIDHYEVWATANRTTPFGHKVVDVAPDPVPANFGGTRIEGFEEGFMLWVRLNGSQLDGESGYYAIRTVYSDGTGSLFYRAATLRPGEVSTLSVNTTVDCGANGTKVHLKGTNPWGPLTQWRIVGIDHYDRGQPIPQPGDGPIHEGDGQFSVLDEGNFAAGSFEATSDLRGRLPEMTYAVAQVTDSDGSFDAWSYGEGMMLFNSCWNGVIGVDAYNTMGHGCEFGEYVGSAVKTSVAGFDPSQCKVDPVNTATGALMASHLDVLMPAPGRPTTWERTYNSNDGRSGMFGLGWSSTYDMGLAVDHDRGVVRFRTGDGQRLDFKRVAGAWQPAPSTRAQLTERPDESFTVTTRDQVVYEFDLRDRLVAIVDRNQNRTDLTWDDTGLASVHDAAGRTLTVDHDPAGRVTALHLPDGHAVSYGYEGDLLTSVTAPNGGVTHYRYDENRRLVEETGPTGDRVHLTTYGPDGRVVEQLDPLGARATFTWDPATETSVMTDAEGGRWTDRYHNNLLIESTDPSGASVSHTYDENLDRVASIDPAGIITSYVHDDDHHVISASRGGSTPATYQWTWDGENQTRMVGPDGGVTERFFDEVGNLTAVTSPGGGTVRFTRQDGVVTAITDPLGNVTSYAYDAAGNLIATTDALGDVSHFAYDASGRVVQTTSPLGAVTAIEYDAVGRVVKTTDPLGAVVTTSYDLAGRKLSSTTPDGITTTFERNAAGEPTAVRDAGQAPTRITYDGTGHVTSTTDPLGAVTSYEYDLAGNTTAVIDPLGNRWSASYADAGRLDSRTDPLGNVTRFTYDDSGRPATVTDPAGGVARSTWDSNGRLATTTDPDGGTTAYAYDQNGNTTAVTDPTGATLHRLFDQANRLVATTSATGARTTFTYDAAGQIRAVVDPRGNAPGADASLFRTTFDYDADGHQTSITAPAQGVTSYGYDLAGNLLSMTDPKGAATSYTYDLARRITSVSDAAGAVTSYGYNPLGDLSSITDPNGGVYARDFDALHRVRASVGPDGQLTTYTYDARGSLLSTMDPNAHAASDPTLGTTNYAYDARGLLTGIDYSRSDTPDVTFSYDAAGRPAAMTDGEGTETRAYDAAGRLRTLGRGTDQLAYAYDAAGRITQRDYPNADPIDYGYDADGRLLTMGRDAATTNYRYDAAGRLAEKTWPSGAATAVSFNPNGDIATMRASSPGGSVVFDAAYDYDLNANPTTENLGARGTTTHSYDQLDRLTESCIDVACSVPRTFGYDASTNLLTKGDATGQTATTFNASHQALSATGARPATYTYDANGNLLSDGQRTYRYDQANRLVSVTQNGTGTGSAPTTGYATAVTDDAPAAYWRLDDEPGSAELAPTVGSKPWMLPPSWAPTRVAGALTPDDGARAFDGDDFLTVADSSPLRTSAFTLEAWLATSSTTGAGTLVRNGVPFLGGWTIERRSDGRLELRRGAAKVATTAPVGAGWHHVALRVNGSAVEWVIDGQSAGTGTANPGFFKPVGGLHVGGADGFSLDEAALYTRAVPSAELQAHVAARVGDYPAAVTSSNPTMWWRLGDPAGTTSLADAAVGHARPATAVDLRPELGVDSPIADGSAVAFGPDLDLAFAPASAVPALNSAFAIETWVKPGSQAGTLLGTGTGAWWGTGMELRRASDGRLEFRRDVSVLRTAQPVSSGDWHHVVVSFDGATVKIFVDGDVQASVARSGFVPQFAALPWGIVGTDASFDEIAFYTHALSPERVQAHGDAADGTTEVEPQETTFRYDGFGSRIEKTTGTETHRYRWDPTWSVPMLIEDRVVGGDATQVSYGVGPESLTTTSGRHDLVTDRMGSVVAVLDEAGNPEASYEWEPDGALRAGQVTTPNAPDLLLGFAGGHYDSDLALYNLRARVYDPLSGRFLQTDPLATPIGQTWQSPYAYVGGKATTIVDPTGMRGEQGYWDAQRNKCNGDGGNIYFVETYRGMQGCYLYNPCVSSWWGPIGDLAEWSCRNHDTLVGILQKTRDISLSLIPGYDCVQIALGRDRSALSYAGCALDLVPFVGSIDEVVTSGAKGLDEALGDMNSVRKAGEEGTEAKRVFNCASSFAAETRVLMADGSTKRIVDVEPGDMVMSADPQTGEQAPREVIATLPHTDDLLLFDTSAGRVVTTEDHRYWNATDGEWQESQDLDTGDRLLSADGDVVRVGGLDWSTVRTAPAYDLTIAGFHTFYVAVGNEHVLVHNCPTSLPGAGGLSDEVRRLAEANITDSGDTVLGSYPGYITKANSQGASFFDIGDAWNALTPAERTAANNHFLDVIAGRGDRVLLSTSKTEIQAGTALADEIAYLTGQKGYVWVNQWSLKPGG